MSAIIYADYLGPDGSEVNMGGTAQICYFAPVDDVLTWGAPAASPANQYVLATAHTMKTGKKFHKAYITLDTGDLEFGENGEMDGRSFKSTFKFFYPGASDDALQLANEIKNDKLIFLVELPDGKVFQLGSSRFFCSVKGNFKTTTTSGRGRGFEFTVECYTPYIYRYAGAIPLTAAA
jgi:hypothetical protein